MPRIFNRTIGFLVQGEIYDNSTKAEDIIRNYTFKFRDFPGPKGESFLVLEHEGSKGRITNLTKLPWVAKPKKPDTEYFLI
jgi:hypothetical protein